MLDKLRHVIVVLTAVCTIVFVVLFVSSLIHGYRFAWEKKIEYMEKKNAGFISENDRSLERELRAKGIVKADVLSDNKNNTSINKEASNNEEQTYLPMLVTVPNPSPDSLPTLAVWQSSTELRVAATFPNVPDFTCDFWCYESAMDCIGIKALEEGQLGLWHLDRNTPEIMYVTTVIPHSDSIEFIVKAQVAPGSDGPLPDKLQAPNICWQLKRAPAFASAPESYPEFFKRCFIFTEDGIGFLGDVPRHPIPCRPLTDKENNPPWVQMYVGAWQTIPEVNNTSWSDYSPTQYVTTIIGAVSRDRKYLAAVVNDSACLMAQAWHDCMHNNASFMPADKPPEERTWRVAMYIMENDPALLLEKAGRDFPNLRPVLRINNVNN